MPPKYGQIKGFIQDAIDEGRWSAGGRLGTMRELCEEFGTSLMTLDRAMRELVTEGVLVRQPNRGFYVSEQPDQLNGTIMVVIHKLDTATSFPAFVSGIEQVARSRNYHVNIFCMHNQVELCMEAAKRAVCLQAKGVIYAPGGGGKAFQSNADALNLMQSHNLPIVLAGHCDLKGFESLPRVSSDHDMAARRLAEHLLCLGHRRIGIVGKGPSSDHSRIANGCRAVFEEHGHAICDRNIHFVPDDGFVPAAVRQLMTSDEKVDAIFAIGDDLAAITISTLRELHLSVPADVAVVGFGDYPVCRYLPVSLTTMRVRHEEEGALTAGLLLDIIEKHVGENRQIEVPCDLVVRQSCGMGYIPRNLKTGAASIAATI